MKTQYESIIEDVLRMEGSYVDDPLDRGNATNMGVTLATLSAFIGREATKDEVRQLDKGTAVQIYKQMYWDKFRLSEFPDNLKHIYFDMAVNHGSHAGRILQTSANNRGKGLDVDGIVGSGTLSALSGVEVEDVLVERSMFYANNGFDGSRYARRTDQQRFIPGWFKGRVFPFATEPYRERIEELEAENKELREQIP